MIWFRIKRLEEKLRNDEVSDKEGLIYLIGNTLLATSALYISKHPYANELLKFADLTFAILITIAGIWISFNINEKGDGKDYFKRYQALTFVIGLRLLVLMTIVAIVSVIALYPSSDIYKNDGYHLLLMVVTPCIFYYNLYKSFQKLNSPD